MTDIAESLAPDGNHLVELPTRLIDLRDVDSASRELAWQGVVSEAFPGLSLKLTPRIPTLGSINRYKMGAGELFAIESAPVEVSYRPLRSGGASPHLSLMVQARGSTRINQGRRECLLSEGDVCLIDESSGFRMVGKDCSGIVFLRLPRSAALGRHPFLERQFATVLPASDAGTRLLAGAMLRLLEEAPHLAELQRAAAVAAMMQMLGVAGPLSALPATSDWRIRRALDFIELNLSIAGLSAEHVAQDQHISRRRLDQLMREALGHSVTGHLWGRRLERAAADLRDPRRAGMTAAQVAFANGFEDAAHFSRAFKRRYGCTPGWWRIN